MASELTVDEQAALTSGADLWHTKPAESAGIPALTLTDGPHGVRLNAADGDAVTGRPATCFPPAVATASTWDPSLLRRMGEALGDECRAMDVAVLLGPGVNIKRSPLGGRDFEYFSEDPLLAGVLAAEWVNGLQSRGVGASLKHFAMNSQETDRMRVSADVDERSLREIYLRAFQRVVTQARPWTVMAAYNKINGVYATEHRWLLTQVLRGEWGFDGLVMSDWGAVADRCASVAAGLDLTMPGPVDQGDRELAEAVREGRLDPEALATAAGRVRTLAARAAARQPSAPGGYDVAAHHALAREIAGRAVVLLKNDPVPPGGRPPAPPGKGSVPPGGRPPAPPGKGEGLLPLPGQDQSIAVLGEFARTPRYQGGGSSQVTPTRLDDALTAIKEATSAPVRFAPGYTADAADPDETLLAEAAELAAGADLAVVFAGTLRETEGADRDGIDLPASHLALIERVAAANPRTVVVLSNGAVVRTTPWDASVPALVEGWLLGQAGGSAIADVLFGRVNPSGRLAETIPRRLADHPSYLDFPGEHGHVRYGEGIYVGYRGFDAREQEVAYPFGFGLSYTTFEYGRATATASVDGIEVRIPVTNAGGRDGREVVQVYVSVPGSRVRRAPRELKAFASVQIAAGQTADVLLTIAYDDLAYWDTRLGRWTVEPGDYHCAVGASSRDLRSTAVAELIGDSVRAPLTAESSLSEWLADPRGAEVIAGAFAAASAGNKAGVSPLFSDPALLEYLASVPLSRITMFPGSPLTPESLDKLIAAANP